MRLGIGLAMRWKAELQRSGQGCDEILAQEFPMRRWRISVNSVLVCCLAASLSSQFAPVARAQDAPAASPAQTSPGESTYKPKFPGDPARSESEAAALGYMRVVLRAQRQFNKQYNHFATTLAELVHSGTFTKRMVNTNRGDYTASFAGKKDSFVLTMTPKQLDAESTRFPDVFFSGVVSRTSSLRVWGDGQP
jgi:hypothetical protein